MTSPFLHFMIGWGWVVFTLIAALVQVISYVANQYLRQPGHLLVFWSRLVTVLALTPAMLQIAWPTDPRFYGAVALTALFGAFADIRLFNVAARYGGGVVSRTLPLIVVLSFFVWFFFDPGLIKRYIAHPINTALILTALSGCVYFSAHLKKCHISRKASIEMLPALLGYTATTVLNKYAMEHGPLTGAVYGYMYMQSALAVVLVGVYALWQEGKTRKAKLRWHTQKMVWGSLLMAFAWIASMTLKNYAMAFIPNPSYQIALGQTTPVFIAAFYWFVKHKEEADVSSGMGVVACAALLAVVTV